MDDDDYFKQQLIRAADLAQPPGWRAYFSEGVGTAMLGAMSIALAIVVFTADAYSLIRNQALGNFHRTEWSHGADHLIPSPVCAMVVVAGEGL
ncbi:MAG TPA: hypothetical protein VKA15_20955, partial [Isosphaeraceae bacterium]|nr:hypothetical protein [Isosphaeraceae bacterium]